MGFTKKIKDILTPMDDDELVIDEEDDELTNEYEEPQNKKVSTISPDTKMVLFEPRTYDEADEIASHLKSKRAAVVNLHRLQPAQAQRTTDFLSGVIFAVDGSIQKIGPKVILCTPKNIGVQGTITGEEVDE